MRHFPRFTPNECALAIVLVAALDPDKYTSPSAKALIYKARSAEEAGGVNVGGR